MSTGSSISVLGLGAMGSRIAANYAAAGHGVTVWNRSVDTAERFGAEHGVSVAQTPRSAAEGADFVVSLVTDDAAACAVWLDPDRGAFAAMGPGAVGIESSTITPGTARRLAREALDADVSFVEAPVVGSRPQAEARALVYLLGGAADDIAAARPVIDVNAAHAEHLGAVGTAATMKLAVNGLFAAQVAVFAEIFGLIERSDLETEAAIDTLTGLPITSPALQRVLGLIGERRYEPNFPVRLVAKDLGYLARAAEELGASVPVLEAAGEVYRQSALGEQCDLDISGIAERYQAS